MKTINSLDFPNRDPESIRGWRRNIFSGHKRTKARFSGLG
jgi:hypothetical protein